MKLKTKLKRQFRKQTTGVPLGRNWLLFLSLFLIGRRIYVSIPTPIISPAVQAREEPTENSQKPTGNLQPTPRVSESPKNLSWPEVAVLIVEEFKDLGSRVTKEALDIAYCESYWQEKAFNDKNKNGSTDSGVFQINSVHKQPNMLQAQENIRFAKEKFIKDGYSFGAWVCGK